jgi:large subunit ribosomal protein L29
VKVAELRVLEADELNGRLRTARRELYELRFKHAVGQLENSSEIAKVRHDIARIMTVLSERELGIEVVTETPEEAPASVRKGPARKEFEDEEPEGEEAAASAEGEPAEPAEPVMEEPVEEAPKPKRGRKSKEEKS